VLDLAADDITVHGYVSDEQLIALYGRAACAVVPLRFGAGVKGKVLEAIRYGVPLITTSIGAEGIPDASDVMRIADEPETFAEAVIDELRNSPQPQNIREQWIERHFGRKAVIASLAD
jgi:glycosyltransferase involved in cell wall biosynthesis